MRRPQALRVAAPLAAALLVPAVSLASGGGGEHDEGEATAHFLWEVVNLALLAAVLFFVARKPVSAYLAERRAGVEQDLESAAKLLSDAESRLAEWSRKADGLEAEVADIKAKARAAAEADGRRIVAEAEGVAQRIEAEAKKAIARETDRARAKLRQEAADLALELAGDLLRQEVTPEDHARLVDEFVARVDGGGSA